MISATLRRIVAPIAASVLVLATAGCSLLGGAPRDDAGNLTATASLSLSALKVGDCIADVNALADTVTKVPAVPCSTPHNGETFGVTTTGTTWLKTYAEGFCRDQFATYIGVPFDQSKLDVMYFSPQDASAKDKTLTCLAYHKDGSTDTKSIKGSKQ